MNDLRTCSTARKDALDRTAPYVTAILLYLSLLQLAGCANKIYRDDIAFYADLDGPAARLTCYDKLAKRLGVDQLAGLDSDQDGWRMRTEISLLNNSTYVYPSMPAMQAFVTSSGQEISPVLYIRCKENTTRRIDLDRLRLAAAG